MNIASANLARVPFLLSSNTALNHIQRNNVDLFGVTNQLSSGKAITRGSEDPIRAVSLTLLSRRMQLADKRQVSLQHAGTVLDKLDSTLTQTADVIRTAQSIASSQIGITSSDSERAQQAAVVGETIRSLYQFVNSTHDLSPQGIHLFGGSTAGSPPVVQVNGGYRYVARGSGMLTDLGLSDNIPITLGGNNAIGETSARVRGLVDLDPSLTALTRLDSLNGARGLGVSTGVVNFTFSGSPAVGTVDLTGAQTVQDVRVRIEAAIRQYETDNSVSVLGPGGVYFTGQVFAMDVVAAGTPQLTFSDSSNGTVAADLGLTSAPFTALAQNGVPTDPRLTWQTSLNSLSGITFPLGSIRIRSTVGGVASIKDIDFSTAQTLEDLRNLVEVSGTGLRLEINQNATGLNLVNEVAGTYVAIEETPGAPNTATQLGLRSYDLSTTVGDFNNGRGVRIVNGVNNPVTGLPDAALNSDFRITLGNGQWFDVDLVPADMTNVQSILAKINSTFAAAVGTQNNPSAPALAAGDFTAGLTTGINGIAFTQTVGPGAISVGVLNNSAAAEDLGLLGLSFDTPSGAYVAQDRAQVRVNNLFSDLIDLQQALLKNDSNAITNAGASLNVNADRLFSAQALVGTYAQRVDQALDRMAGQKIEDEQAQETLQGVDFAEAATRMTQLQTQLEASLRVAGIVGSRSLFDFLS